jgi:hypothetical protein
LVYTNGLADIVYWHGWQGETQIKLGLQKKSPRAERFFAERVIA